MRTGFAPRKTVGMSLLAVLALAACTPPPDNIPVSRTAGPGSEYMAAYDAGVIFADVCLTRGSKFETAKEGMAGFDFTQNAQTGTYYHNSANLSVKVRPEECSMVYVTDAETKETVSELARGTASVVQKLQPGVSVTSSPYPGGARAYRLGIKS